MPAEDQFDRRRFFREGLRRLIGHAEKAAEPIARFAKEMEKLETASTPPASSASVGAKSASGKRPVTLPLVLRPPGALQEEEYLSACTRCGECIAACPAQCITVDHSAGGLGKGAPHILAEAQPCVLCDSLACMHVCPTGALQVVPRLAIRMGKAVWGEGKCVRGDGEECRVCLETCPLGEAAISLSAEGRIEVHDACTGCGQCQYACPTTPRAIVVVPGR
jgi:ferredoxin-type protein NapG